jgi:dissimilatory sulfite reductase (desulfoviridin) alpha/beta subunit
MNTIAPLAKPQGLLTGKKMKANDLYEPEDLELDFNDIELKKARSPIPPPSTLGPESTHPLTEAPAPAGANLNPRADLEPILVIEEIEADKNVETENQKVYPPPFFLRLGLESREGAPLKVEKTGERSWSLANGQAWPVFVKKIKPHKLCSPAALKKLALAARRFGDNRLCLGATGDLEVFFNDRGSLERFEQELFGFPDLFAPASPGPVRLSTCRGLFSCPLSAIDALSATEKLEDILNRHLWLASPIKRKALTITVAGCGAGQGIGCGIYQYSDLRLIGKRIYSPVIDQETLALSPVLNELIIGCPGRAIKRSHKPKEILEIVVLRCRRCGWCVYFDPSFSFPAPQGGYFSLELSGRKSVSPYEYITPIEIWSKLPEDWVEIGLKLIELIENWRGHGERLESLAEFAVRKKLFAHKSSSETEAEGEEPKS